LCIAAAARREQRCMKKRRILAIHNRPREPMQLRHKTRLLCMMLLACLALVGTGGCATSFFYERADRFTERWLDGHLELGEVQQAELAAGLEDLHAWHRREHLPDYAAWLRAVAGRLERVPSPSSEELQGYGEQLAAWWRELAETSLPLLVRIGSQLDDARVAALLASLHEERREELEAAERADPAREEARRARSMERFLRRFTGSLRPAQRDALAAWSATMEASRIPRLENRLGWIQELEEALERRREPGALAAAAYPLVVTPTRRWKPAYAALAERNRGRTMAFMADFLAGLEPRQRERAVDRLRKLADELEALSAEAG